ncbi:C40 family peptidase [Caballeronia sp. dw_276]|uniref:C40 family peptidase n=1 Tax=Caballeronia sp. dw_276 TaxID=2719795 RepID=UPI001BD1C13D|nr:C40 family peptidase [Caballeronia sp. dw_276]
MNDDIKDAIADHAIAEYPREAVGLVVLKDGEEVYIPCRNIALNPRTDFALHPRDFAHAEDAGQIVALAHSHPDETARPRTQDKVTCEKSDIAQWIIVSISKRIDGSIGVDEWCEFGPTGFIAPLLSRTFVHGVLDCYALGRDWYRIERGIVLPDIARADEWWNDGRSNLYIENYERAGFSNVGTDVELQVGDALLMQIRSKNGVPNHCGVYLGDGAFIHHFYGQLSRRESWGGLWARSLQAVLRYVGDQK